MNWRRFLGLFTLGFLLFSYPAILVAVALGALIGLIYANERR